MEALRITPFLGLAIALSIGFDAQAQYYPAAPMAAYPQQMIMIPQPMHGGMPMMAGSIGMPTMAPGMAPGMAPRTMMASTPMAAAIPGKFRNGVAAGNQPQKQRGQAVAESENFIVFASDSTWAAEVAKTAEKQRRELAEHWLGRELPQWAGRCPIHVQDAPELGAGGETRFVVEHGVAHNWMMSVQGTRERILDSVLPHEISHTIFATHFGRLNKYVPRWADEGAATTVEHEAEKSKHRFYLKKFLQTGRGLAFNKMFQLKEYPKDILPLYAQGHSAVQFLIDQSSPQHFVQFLEMGMQTENWIGALAKFYEYESIGDFQARWNKWLADSSPADLIAYAPLLSKRARNPVALASATTPQPQMQPQRQQQIETGRLPSDPKSLELMPSYSMQTENTVRPAVNEFASATEPNKQRNQAYGGNGQQDSLLSLDDAVALAAAQQPSAATAQSASDSAGSAEGESWFKRKLHQTSGQPATPIPQHNSFPGDNYTASARASSYTDFVVASSPTTGLRPAERNTGSNSGTQSGTSTALPQKPQSVNVQVLEWGQGLRFSGLPSENPAAGQYR